MSDAPLQEASGLIERVYRLLVEAHLTRERLIAMAAADSAQEAEREVYLGLVSALEDGLRRALEEALATLKSMKAGEAEAWLRQHLGGLEHP